MIIILHFTCYKTVTKTAKYEGKLKKKGGSQVSSLKHFVREALLSKFHADVFRTANIFCWKLEAEKFWQIRPKIPAERQVPLVHTYSSDTLRRYCETTKPLGIWSKIRQPESSLPEAGKTIRSFVLRRKKRRTDRKRANCQLKGGNGIERS
jgi:hypothetical protein